jgi:histidyl-tRNA synthetase
LQAQLRYFDLCLYLRKGVMVIPRYDVLVQEFWKVANDNADLKCSSVGFSLSLERTAAILKKMEPELPSALCNVEVNIIIHYSTDKTK